MRFLNKMQIGLAAATVAASTFGAEQATACDRAPRCPSRECLPEFDPHCEPVLSYRLKLQPVEVWVTVTDDYGCRRRVRKTVYRLVTVPVVNCARDPLGGLPDADACRADELPLPGGSAPADLQSLELRQLRRLHQIGLQRRR